MLYNYLSIIKVLMDMHNIVQGIYDLNDAEGLKQTANALAIVDEVTSLTNKLANLSDL